MELPQNCFGQRGHCFIKPKCWPASAGAAGFSHAVFLTTPVFLPASAGDAGLFMASSGAAPSVLRNSYRAKYLQLLYASYSLFANTSANMKITKAYVEIHTRI